MIAALSVAVVGGLQFGDATAELSYACAIDSVAIAKRAIERGADISVAWPEANPKMLRLVLDHGWPLAPERGRSYAHVLVDEFEKRNGPWGYGGGRPISGPSSKKKRPPDGDFFECLKIYRAKGGTLLSPLEDDHPMGYGRKGQIPLVMAVDFAEANGGRNRKHMRPMVEVLAWLTLCEVIGLSLPTAQVSVAEVWGNF